jgi:protein JSN1
MLSSEPLPGVRKFLSNNVPCRCCIRFGQPANDFIFDAMVDRLWEIAQGRFGARSMRACLESPNITISQQRRIATYMAA